MKRVNKKVKRFIENFKEVITRPEMAVLPGHLAYFFVLAIIPTMTLVSMGAAFLNFSTEAIFDFLSSAFSTDLAHLILSSELTFGTSGISAIVVILLAYYLASNGASSIIVTSNTIYGIKNDSYIHRKIKSFIMIFILIFLFTFMLVIPMFGDSIIDLLRVVDINTSVTNNVTLVIRVLQGPILWLIIFLFVKLIYTMAPDKKIDSSMVNYGAIFTTTMWMVVTWVYSIYINNYADYDVLYGNLANLVILMLWFYFLAFIFTIGLALNYHKEEKQNTSVSVFKEESKQ